jgi:hypothetical protein
MSVKDHGKWVLYKPEPHPEAYPKNVIFAKREGDGVDWYDYVRGDNFGKDTIKFALDERDGKTCIRAPVVDADRLFPAGCRVVEVTNAKREQNEEKLIDEFANRYFDPHSGTVGEVHAPQLPPNKTEQMLEKIMARLDKLEQK